MKTKKELIVLVAIFCATGMFAVTALAKNAKSDEKSNNSSNSVKEDKISNSNGNASSSIKTTDSEVNGNGNSEKVKTNNAGEDKNLKNSIQEEGEAASEKSNGKSEVSKNLKKVAESEAEIAEELEELAAEEEETTEEIEDLSGKLKTQSKTKTFLFGTDYKNLGQLRSEMVQNRNQIRQLTQLIGQVQDGDNKTALQEQLELMVQERERINTIITEEEDSFSLFGWAFRLINGYEKLEDDEEEAEEEDELQAEIDEALADTTVEDTNDDTEEGAEDETFEENSVTGTL